MKILTEWKMALSLCAGVYLEPSHVFKGLIILRFSAHAEHFNLANRVEKNDII